MVCQVCAWLYLLAEHGVLVLLHCRAMASLSVLTTRPPPSWRDGGLVALLCVGWMAFFTEPITC